MYAIWDLKCLYIFSYFFFRLFSMYEKTKKIKLVKSVRCVVSFKLCGFLVCKEIILKNVDENAHLPFDRSGPQSHCSRNFPLVTPLQNPSASLFSWLNCSLSEHGKYTAKIKGKIQLYAKLSLVVAVGMQAELDLI